MRSFTYAEGPMVKSTYYRYDERQYLIALTDALNQTTLLGRYSYDLPGRLWHSFEVDQP